MNSKYENYLSKFSDLAPLLPSLSKWALLKKIIEIVDRPIRPNGTSKIKKRGEFLIGETVVAAAPRRVFFI